MRLDTEPIINPGFFITIEQRERERERERESERESIHEMEKRMVSLVVKKHAY